MAYNVAKTQLRPEKYISILYSIFSLLFPALRCIWNFSCSGCGGPLQSCTGRACSIVCVLRDLPSGPTQSPQATSQQRFLPALTPGNMKITGTITLIMIHPSVAEGQRLLAFPTAGDYAFN